MRWPCSEAMLSGWNCTPCTGAIAVAHAHDHAVIGVRGRHFSASGIVSGAIVSEW